MPLSDFRLYGIIDLGYVKPADIPQAAQDLMEGGVDILQLRAKHFSSSEVEKLAASLLPITRAQGVPLVINDHPEVAASVGAEGVHVGQDDHSVERARAVVGSSCFVGKSTHSVAQARAAMAEGADYIGFGPLYATGTKPDYVPIGLDDITEVHSFATVPVFCIGGVNLERLPEVLAAGARRVVVVSAFLLAPARIDYVRSVKQRLS